MTARSFIPSGRWNSPRREMDWCPTASDSDNIGVTMTSTQPARGMSGRHTEGQGYGLVFFASVLLVIIGFFNLIYGIAAIANSHVFTADAHYVFGSLRTWGWITLIIGVLQLAAAAGRTCKPPRTVNRYGRTPATSRRPVDSEPKGRR